MGVFVCIMAALAFAGMAYHSRNSGGGAIFAVVAIVFVIGAMAQ